MTVKIFSKLMGKLWNNVNEIMPLKPTHLKMVKMVHFILILCIFYYNFLKGKTKSLMGIKGKVFSCFQM